ncbi:MAG: hypothetical protein VB140_05890 [Burkholderia sp.]
MKPITRRTNKWIDDRHLQNARCHTCVARVYTATCSGITWLPSIDAARPARFHPKSARFGLPELAGAELHYALSPGKNA